MFTWQRFRLPVPFTKCLATANIFENPQGGVQKKAETVTRWRAAEMVERWVASAWLLTANRFRRIGGKLDLWALAPLLGPACAAKAAETDRVA